MSPPDSPEVMAAKLDQMHRDLREANQALRDLRADFNAEKKSRYEERERNLRSGLKVAISALVILGGLVWQLRRTVVEGGQ